MVKIDAHYSDTRLVELYDSGNGWSEDRNFYLNLAGLSPIHVLDLGCGTGLICDVYSSRGHQVTGVDPAANMLKVARRKPNGSKIEWVHSDAQHFTSEKRYNLITMTGHAFQVLLTEDDVKAVFEVMKDHLAHNGTVAFESRNPNIDWALRWHKKTFRHMPPFEKIEALCEVKDFDHQRIHFEIQYRFDNEVLVSSSELRFWTFEQISRLLAQSGLKISHCFGDWDCSAFDPSLSLEMIFIAKAV